jgi:hypothetical protein
MSLLLAETINKPLGSFQETLKISKTISVTLRRTQSCNNEGPENINPEYILHPKSQK